MTLAVFVAGLAVVSALLWGAGRRLFATIDRHLAVMERMEKVHVAYMEGPRSEFEARMRHLEDLCEMLPQRWDQIRKEAERFDGRARSAVRRVTEELEERGLSDDTINALNFEVRQRHGEGSPEGELPAMPAPVEPAPFHGEQLDWRDEIRQRIALKNGAR